MAALKAIHEGQTLTDPTSQDGLDELYKDLVDWLSPCPIAEVSQWIRTENARRQTAGEYISQLEEGGGVWPTQR